MNKNIILSFVLTLFIIGIIAPIGLAYIDIGDGGGGGSTTYTSTRTSTKYATKTGSYLFNRHTYYAQETRSGTATATRTSTISQVDADNLAKAAADAAAQALADTNAQNAANTAAYQLAISYKTALFVHGWGFGTSSDFASLKTLFDAIGWFTNTISIDFYAGNSGCETEFYEYGVSVLTPIEIVACLLKNYILRMHATPTTDPEHIGDSLFLIAHSMGGLVCRQMVKYYYDELKTAGITVRHLATLATPNFGAPIGGFSFTTQGFQMASYWGFHDLLNNLNTGDRTPYSVSDSSSYADIRYSTYSGDLLDIIVPCWNVALDNRVWVIFHPLAPITHLFSIITGTSNDARNHNGYVGIDHAEVLTDITIQNQLFYNIYRLNGAV